MVINGHLKFHTLGSGELQNAIIERLTAAPTGAAGRIYYNDGQTVASDLGYWYHDGTAWRRFLNLSEYVTAMGNVVNADGTYNSTAMNGLSNVDGSTDLFEAISDLNAAIGVAAGVDTLPELTDVDNLD